MTGGRKPFLNMPEQGASHFAGLERLINRADHVDQGVAVTEPFVQSLSTQAEPGGEVCLSAARGGGWIRTRCSRHRSGEDRLPLSPSVHVNNSIRPAARPGRLRWQKPSRTISSSTLLSAQLDFA